MMGPADQQCGRGRMDSLSVLRLQVGGNHEDQTWARRGSQTALQFSYWLCSGEWALFLSLHGPFTITVEKGRNPQTHGRVQVLDKRNGSRVKKPLQRLAKVHVQWCVVCACGRAADRGGRLS